MVDPVNIAQTCGQRLFVSRCCLILRCCSIAAVKGSRRIFLLACDHRVGLLDRSTKAEHHNSCESMPVQAHHAMCEHHAAGRHLLALPSSPKISWHAVVIIVGCVCSFSLGIQYCILRLGLQVQPTTRTMPLPLVAQTCAPQHQQAVSSVQRQGHQAQVQSHLVPPVQGHQGQGHPGLGQHGQG